MGITTENESCDTEVSEVTEVSTEEKSEVSPEINDNNISEPTNAE